MPIYITNDWIYWAIGSLMGFSSGYLRYFLLLIQRRINSNVVACLACSSLAMMYAPQTVAPQHAQTAGMFAAAMLITGIFTGITSSAVHSSVVQSLSW